MRFNTDTEGENVFSALVMEGLLLRRCTLNREIETAYININATLETVISAIIYFNPTLH